MPQLYIQKNAQPDTWVMAGAPTATTVFLSLDAAINYSDGTSDTLAANTLAVLPDTTTVFDRTHDVFVCYTVQTSRVLSVIKESLLPTLTSAYAPLCRIELHGIKPYQPEPYLAASGLGSTGASNGTTLSSAPGQGHTFLLGTEPSGWQGLGFDDSAWGGALADVYSVYTLPSNIAGADYICCRTGDRPTSETWLYRYTFSLPVGPITAATLQIDPDDYCRGAWINGTLLAGSDQGTTTPRAPLTLSVPPSLLVAGSANVLALKVENNISGGGSGGPSRLAHALVVNSVPTGGLPAPASPAEGDLLSYHAGAWVRVAIGTSGQELTVVAGAPAWTTPPAAYTDPLTVEGDLPYRHGGATTRLPLGATSGYALLSNATDPYWGDVAAHGATRHEPVAHTDGTILVTASGAPVMALASNAT